MRAAARIGVFLGLALAIAVIVREGGPRVAEALARAGTVLLWLVPLHLLPLALDCAGWHVLLGRRAAMPVLLWIASVREAVNRLLPVASIGGDIVGIRLLAGAGVGASTAAASVVMELLLNLASQLLFATLGSVLLLRLTGAVALREGLCVGLLAALTVVLAFGLLLRYGTLFTRAERLIARVLGIAGLPGLFGQLDVELQSLYMERGRLAATVGLQLAGLVAGSIESWLALRWLGHPVGFSQAIVLESVVQALRQVAFVIPAGLGVQEAGLVGIGYLLGVSSGVSLALSLARRMREVLFGLPALASWQWVEGWKGLQHARSQH